MVVAGPPRVVTMACSPVSKMPPNTTMPVLLRTGVLKTLNGPVLSAMLVKVYDTAAAWPADRASATARRIADAPLRMIAPESIRFDLATVLADDQPPGGAAMFGPAGASMPCFYALALRIAVGRRAALVP